MKTTVITLFILTALLSVPVKAISPGNLPSPGPYAEVKKDQDITLYSRWVPVSETVRTRQIKAVFTCKADPADAVALLRDEHSYLLWMNGTKTFNKMKASGDQSWYSYVCYSLPWPLKDMDCILKFTVEDLAENNGVRILINGVPDYIRVNNGVTRIPHLECEWLIRKSGQGAIIIEYVQFSNQPSKFPRWIIDPIFQGSLIKSMNAFRNMVETHHASKK